MHRFGQWLAVVIASGVLLEAAVRAILDPDRDAYCWHSEIVRGDGRFSAHLDPNTAWHYTYDGIHADDSTFVDVWFSDGRTIRFRRRKPLNALRIVFVGDSVTQPWPRDGTRTTPPTFLDRWRSAARIAMSRLSPWGSAATTRSRR